MSTPTIQLIFLPVKSSIRPEDSSSIEGKAFLDLLAQKKDIFGDMIWGRSVDKPDIIGIGVEILSTGSKFPASLLSSFESSTPTELLVPARLAEFVSNPVTEIAVLPLSEALTEQEIATTSVNSTTFGKALLVAPAPVAYSPGTMALSYQSGWAAGLPKNRLVMMIGWRAVENHMEAAKTLVFIDNLKPIVDHMTGQLEVTHLKFQKL